MQPVTQFAYIEQCRDVDNYVDSANGSLGGIRSASDHFDIQMARYRAALQLALLSGALGRCLSRALDLADPSTASDDSVQAIVNIWSEELEADYGFLFYGIKLRENTNGFNGSIPEKTKSAMKAAVDVATKAADGIERFSTDPTQQARASAIRQQLDSWTFIYHL